jgi:alkaline phosphatase
MISMLPDSTYLEPITALLARNGYANALVATSSITHATPAAFYSNSLSRYDYEGIATQLHSSYIDFVAAGGYQYFVQRTDGVNYFDSLSYHHFTIDTNSLAQALQADHKYAFLLAKGDLEASGAGRGDFLPAATNKALEYLSMKDQPFFLMVESSQIDWACHANDTAYLRNEMLDFEKTVAVAIEYAKQDTNTIVIVTADHETGAYAISAHDSLGYDVLSPRFASEHHSAALVPLLLYGNGSEKINGILNNTELYEFMKSMQ